MSVEGTEAPAFNAESFCSIGMASLTLGPEALDGAGEPVSGCRAVGPSGAAEQAVGANSTAVQSGNGEL
jgi:hypothetical protein